MSRPSCLLVGLSVWLLQHVIQRQAKIGGAFTAHERRPQTNSIPVCAQLIKKLLEVGQPLLGVNQRPVDFFPFVVDGKQTGFHARGFQFAIDFRQESLIQMLSTFISINL